MIDNKVEEIKKLMDQVMNVLEIPRTESNENTPLRIAKMLCNEVFVNRNDRNIELLGDKMKTFPNEYESGLVILRDIEFSSMCEHHWLPFIGKATVGYVPNDTIVGLSKIPRVVKYYIINASDSVRPLIYARGTTSMVSLSLKPCLWKSLQCTLVFFAEVLRVNVRLQHHSKGTRTISVTIMKSGMKNLRPE